MSNGHGYGFAAKWSQELEQSSFTQVPNGLIRCQGHLGLSEAELVTLIQLLSFWFHSDSRVFPTIKKLSEYSGKAYPTIQKRLKSLEEKGFIERRQRRNNSSIYTFESCVTLLQRHQLFCNSHNPKRVHHQSNLTHPDPSFITN